MKLLHHTLNKLRTKHIRHVLTALPLLSWLLSVQFFNTSEEPVHDPPANKCRACHTGIEPIRDYQSQMMKEILKIAAKAGYPGNDCIVCHGGQPDGKTFKEIHSGTVEYFRTHPGPRQPLDK